MKRRIALVVLIILWTALCITCFGIPGIHYVLMRRASNQPWQLKIDKNYRPKVSIIIPTYNESEVIQLKLENLSKIAYPANLVQTIVVDSKSDDGTAEIIKDFVEKHPETKIRALIETVRKGKSSALNAALGYTTGDIVIVSDADCFLPADVLNASLPFLSDPSVGAISGPKILLNSNQSWATKTEGNYLESMNLVKLGESKKGSTLFFEGGFSAYKRELLDSFDSYNTGSDDCGTIMTIIEKGFRALFVPEALFYTPFPKLWTERISMKVRRGNQLVRVFWRYARMLSDKRIGVSREVLGHSILTYLLNPILFIALILTSVFGVLVFFPYSLLIFLPFFVPRIRFYLFEVIQGYLVLFFSIVTVVLNRRFVIWNKPKDRALLKKGILVQHGLL